MSEPNAATGAGILEDLAARGLLADHTDLQALRQRLGSPTPLYCGFDPTADSLHIGNLQSIMLLRRFQLAGHPPVALVGGATGMIGDPSGRSSERSFLDPHVLDANRGAIGEQLGSLLDFGAGPSGATLVDNRDWTAQLGVIEFLRDVGKHVTINTMLAKDSVRTRMERESGISFTEFSYMLLQAHDFRVLHEREGVDLQVAGSDQWGNITAGVDLVRRSLGEQVHGLTAPLIVRSDGAKFGKSEGDNVWLSAHRTSPYQMYQYLLNIADDDVEPLLARLTLVPVDECHSVAEEHRRAPQRRTGQRRLAREVTAMVHGDAVLATVEAATEVVFGGSVLEADVHALELLAGESPSSTLGRSEVVGAEAVEVLVRCGLAGSKGEIRRNANGYYLNGVAVSELIAHDRAEVSAGDLLHDRFLLLQRGRKHHHIVVVDQ